MTQRRNFAWMDLLWLALLGGLAVLPPRTEIHKQLILIAIGVFQIFEHRFLERFPDRGRSYIVIVKIILAWLLVDHTGVNSCGTDASSRSSQIRCSRSEGSPSGSSLPRASVTSPKVRSVCR